MKTVSASLAIGSCEGTILVNGWLPTHPIPMGQCGDFLLLTSRSYWTLCICWWLQHCTDLIHEWFQLTNHYVFFPKVQNRDCGAQTDSLPKAGGGRRQLGPKLNVNSVWPSDAIWRQGSRSTLVQVVACCLTVPSHYLNQCWLVITKVQWCSSEGNFTWDVRGISHPKKLENNFSKILLKSPRVQWGKVNATWVMDGINWVIGHLLPGEII